MATPCSATPNSRKNPNQVVKWNYLKEAAGKHFHVVCNVGISRKDCPLTFDRYSTKKDVHNRNHYSLSPAPIASLGSLFVIRHVDRFVRKGAKVETKLFKLVRCLYTRKQLLPNQTNKSRSPLSN